MIDLSRVRWVFFDVGCTLSDESAALEDRLQQVAAVLTRVGNPRSVDEVRSAYAQAQGEYVQSAFVRAAELLKADLNQLVSETHWRNDLERPYPSVKRVLKLVASLYNVGIIANQSAGTLQRMCNWKLGEYITLCISSTEEGLFKPDPAIYQLALDRAQCGAAEAVMVGDRLDNDIKSAKMLGMQTIRVLQGPTLVQTPRDATETPDVTVSKIADVPSVLGLI